VAAARRALRLMCAVAAVPGGCGVRAWGPDSLGTGAQGRGHEGAEGVDVDYTLSVRAGQTVRATNAGGEGHTFTTPGCVR